MKKIIVTGGTGYIGSHVVVDLIEKGYTPIVIDNLSNSEKSVIEGIEKIANQKLDFYEVDICDEAGIQKVFDKHNDCLGIIHFAALKAVGESVEQPIKYYHNNITGLINIIQAMDRNNISHLIFSSSCTVYGQPEKLPVTESTPFLAPTSPYGHTKQLGEQIIENYIKANDSQHAISLRYFNPIGAHESALIGELPIGIPNNLMPYITQTAVGLRDCLNVFGNDYNTHDGTAIRDYIHVTDLAKAHTLAMEKLLDRTSQKRYDYYNLGVGKGQSVLDVIHSFERSTGESLNYKIVDRRPGDAEAIYANTEKANTELGWQAQYTLDDMTSSAWRWQLALADKA
jgi:UDP-glucose 4-epimerase